MSTITLEQLPEFKKNYQIAVDTGASEFDWHGWPVYTAYAKYVIEYLESINNKVNEKQNNKLEPE